MNDFKFAVRQLLKNPGFTTVAVLTLALGIGATTAIYSVVSTVLLNPVPGPEPDRLIEIGERSHGNKDEPRFGGVTTHSLEALRSKDEFFTDVIWMDRLDLERKDSDFIELISGVAVPPNFFSQWDIKPVLGRTFGKDEAVRRVDWRSLDRDAVMVVSYSFWQSRLGGQADVLGKVIEANGHHFTIIGVMPRYFQFPNGAHPTVWIPVENSNPQETLQNIRMFVRLKAGVAVEQAQAMLDTVAGQLLQEHPDVFSNEWRKRGGGFGFLTRPLRHAFTQAHYRARDLQGTLFGLLAAIGFVLLIACVNIANLMLARTEKRQQELAIRAAVGASRMRLMRQLLAESALLAGFGAVAGLVVTFYGMKLLVLLIPETMPRLRAIEVDGHALAVTVLVSAITVLAFGLVPAWLGGRASVNHALKQAGTGSTVTLGWRRYRSGLVVTEVALALILLTGAGLMIESVIRLLQVNPGFDPENLLFANPGLLRDQKYSVNPPRAGQLEEALYAGLHERIAALPAVKAVGISKIGFFQLGFILEGREDPIGLLPAGTGVGESDLFRAMSVPLLAGRYFEPSDIGEKVGTVIINETMARLCWPGESSLNKKFRNKGGRVFEVVGVAGDVRIDRYDEKVEPMFYRPYQEQAHHGGRGPFFVVRTQRDPSDLIAAIRSEIKAVEPNMTTPWFHVVRQKLYDATQAQRTYTVYLVAFAVVGLLLSAIGIYGVLAYSVTRRTREIGVRMALGAQRSHVLRMVMSEGARLAALGTVVGLFAAFCLTRLLRHQLFEVSPTEPRVFIAVAIVLLFVALIACFLPARRATRINPMEALRHE